MAFAIEILDRSQFEEDIPHAQLFVDASPTWLYISELIPQRIPPLSLKSRDLYQVTNCSETADKQSQEEYINPFIYQVRLLIIVKSLSSFAKRHLAQNYLQG